MPLYRWTSCKFNQRMKTDFTAGNDPFLEIRVEGGTGRKVHPPGAYRIPRVVALRFFQEKSLLPCWESKSEWTCKTVPLSLSQYFKADR